MKFLTKQSLGRCAILLTCVSCGTQRGTQISVEKPTHDSSPPKFIAEPHVATKTATTAEIVFALNEKTTGALVVQRTEELALSRTQIESSNNRQDLTTKAFETVRVSLDKLEGGKKYKFYLTVQDESGNVLGQPFVKEFETAEINIDSHLSGEPSVAYQGVFWIFKPEGLQADCQIAVLEGPTWLKVAPDGSTLQGTPVWKIGQKSQSFKVNITGPSCRGEQEYQLKTAGDPLFDYAWHINPNSSKTFSWFGAKANGIIPLYATGKSGLTGAGVSVAIVDSGLQQNHPDLIKNIDKESSINLDPILNVACQVCEETDTTPPLVAGDPADRGTAVAGIIAAQGWNGQGSRGVAPNARISAYNLKATRLTAISDTDYQRIFSINSDIICHSGTMGPEILETASRIDFDSYDSGQKRKITKGRQGLGTVFIKAAGDLGAYAGNSALDQRNNTSWAIVVGSHNMMGVKSRHASSGANLWISAPGGEAGFQSDYREFEYRQTVVDFYPSVVSTDVFNEEYPCSVGYAKKPVYFAQDLDPDPSIHSLGHSSGFNMGWNPLNADCQYTATMPSSPAAAAMASGATAILLEANPQLGWRDIKYIYARTAYKIDSQRRAEITNIGQSQYERTLPWIRNSGGFDFHNWYGFGALDLKAALEMANPKTYRNLPEVYDSNWILADAPMRRIPVASISGVNSSFQNIKNVVLESVQVKLDITHSDISSVGLELVSPTGTRSILKPVKDGAHFANMSSMVFLSNAFYGERAMGSWQIRVVDSTDNHLPGSLNSWSIRLIGHQKTGE
jgi:hypothetical protein